MEFQNKIGSFSESQSASDINGRRPYRPRSTRTWLLVLYTVVVLVCIILLQLLVSFGSDFTPGRKLVPKSPVFGSIVRFDGEEEDLQIEQRLSSHQIRQEDSLPPDVPVTTTSTTSDSQRTTPVSTVAHTSFLATTGVTSSPDPDSESFTPRGSLTTESSVASQSFLATTGIVSPPGHGQPSSFLDTENTTPRSTTTPTPPSSSLPDTDHTSSVPGPTTTSSVSHSKFLNTGDTAPPSSSVSHSKFLGTSVTTRPVSTIAHSGFLDTSNAVQPGSTPTTDVESSFQGTSSYSISHGDFLDPQQTAAPNSDVSGPRGSGQITDPAQEPTATLAPNEITSEASQSIQTVTYVGEDGKTSVYSRLIPPGTDTNLGVSPTAGQQNPGSPAESGALTAPSNVPLSTSAGGLPGSNQRPDLPASTSTPVFPASTSTPAFKPLPDRFVLLREPGPMSARQYFAVVFLPKVLAVATQAVWSVSHAAVKLMEPFYQLGSSGGANAQSSLLADYASNELSWQSLVDMFRGQWTLLFSNIITIMLFVVVTLIAEVLTIVPTNFCKTEISDSQPCEPALYADTVLLHTIQALLALVVVSLIAIAILNYKRCSRVFSDPSKLASLATLLGHQPLMQSLLGSDPTASDRQVSREFRNSRYSLGYFHDDGGVQSYGITESDMWDPYSERNPNSHHGADTNNTMLSQLYEMYEKTWLESFVLSLVIALFSVVLAYYFVGSGSFNDFMSNQTFGPTFVLSCGAVVIVMGLRSIERRERILQLYRAMARSPQRAEDSVLLSLGGTPYIGLFNGFAHKWHFISLISFTTILADLMQIAVSGVPFEGGQTLESYKVCTYISLAILGLMAIVIILVIGRTRRLPGPPRSPARLVNALLYLCGGNLLHQQTGISDNQALYQRYQGRYFSFRCVDGPDGKSRWTIFEVDHPKYPK